MENIKFKGKEYKIAYTFNSFKYMADLDLRDLAELDFKPFKFITILETLMLGALNHDPKKIIAPDVVMGIVEQEATNGNAMEVITGLVELLQETAFFKQLQAE